ncbi:Gpr1 family protein [Coprinopsis cinerea okayama7|uniref:Gpr1 family protein n=1 Tax=Coprinopsis cinerea (strain Okayama-7 / 130 / ATCC MYA-4618 / FGSC 9003) TaxID=240176 RepID=A8NND9_COPC7|nr:Gpr1 family protein [Coprinopsis cinerea okayama7\|eukprot:XP_001835110.1 Gpr1 family protein [Coprinopsis cinerea okayama7\
MSNGVAGDIEKAYVQATDPRDAVRSAPGYEVAAHPSRIANPGALGLFSFASTTLILSLYNAQARGITTPNLVVGMALGCGGLAQLLAGMWEFPRGNMFAATAFTSYGAFWLSYATIMIPSSGILASYGDDTEQLKAALGIWLTTWCIVTFFFLIVALRKNVTFIALFTFLTVTFLALAVGDFTTSTGWVRAGGVLGVITAFIAYYAGISELLAAEDMAIARPPLGVFTRRI